MTPALEAEYRAALEHVVRELSANTGGVDRLRLVARCRQALAAGASADGAGAGEDAGVVPV